MRLKRVMRLDTIQRHFRLFRLMWERGIVGFGNGGYSAKLSIAVEPKLFRKEPAKNLGFNGWLVTVFGVRVHYERSYGGIYA